MSSPNQPQERSLYESSGAKEIVVRSGHSLVMWGVGTVVVGLALWFGVPWVFNKMIWAPVEATVEATREAVGTARDATHDAIVTTRQRTGDAVEAAREQAEAARRRAAEIGAGALDTTVSTAGNMRETLGAAAGQAGEALAGAQEKLGALKGAMPDLPDVGGWLGNKTADPAPAQPDVQ